MIARTKILPDDRDGDAALMKDGGQGIGDVVVGCELVDARGLVKDRQACAELFLSDRG